MVENIILSLSDSINLLIIYGFYYFQHDPENGRYVIPDENFLRYFPVLASEYPPTPIKGWVDIVELQGIFNSGLIETTRTLRRFMKFEIPYSTNSMDKNSMLKYSTEVYNTANIINYLIRLSRDGMKYYNTKGEHIERGSIPMSR